MNKRIKRIIATTLAISAFSTIAPAGYFNLIATEAYASTTGVGISNLRVNDGSSSDSLQLYKSSDCDSGDKTSFSNGESSYYVETSSNGVNVTFSEEGGYYAKVKRGSSGDYDSGNRIHIADGDRMTLNVYVYDKSTDKQVSRYSISVKQTSDESSSSSHHYYNDSDYDDDDVYLDDIRLSDGDISFSSTKSTYNVNVGSSVNEIRVTAKPDDEDDTVKINGDTVDDNDNYRKTVALSNGKNEITIRVKDEDNKLRTYTLYIYRGGSSDTTSNTEAGKDDNYQDDIYLDDLIFDNNAGHVNINFRPKVTTYNVNVSSTCDSVILKATPEVDDNIVRINGEKVNSKYSRRVDLKEGKNVINVKVDNSDDYDSDHDDYENRIYTLNVYRGTVANTTDTTTANTTTTTNTNTNTTATTVKVNQWVTVNGKWQYNDYSGQPLKNQWFYDSPSAKWYCLDSEGFVKTGWAQMGPSWYYFNANGSMATGWVIYDGKYYYLDENGIMQKNTTISGYKLGFDGAWVR